MKKSTEIRGCTAEEIAEAGRVDMVEAFKKCSETWNAIKVDEQILEREKALLERRKQDYEHMLLEYRACSVYRVISYIRARKITDALKLDLLLCHCQNKLNGGIDGVELNLQYKEKGEKDGKV